MTMKLCGSSLAIPRILLLCYVLCSPVTKFNVEVNTSRAVLVRFFCVGVTQFANFNSF